MRESVTDMLPSPTSLRGLNLCFPLDTVRSIDGYSATRARSELASSANPAKAPEMPSDRDDACRPPRAHSCCTPMGNYIFTLTPTFTQGLVLGQLSILLLVYFILKYLFFDPKSARHPEESPEEDAPFFRPSFPAEKFISTAFLQKKVKEQDGERDEDSVESAEWLNVLLKQVSSRVLGEQGRVDP